MDPRRGPLSLSLDLPEGHSFDGPLDLLLFLIKRNEVDIYDLPVSLITAQYLDYLRYMESLNLDVAGDFLVMASTLAQIKSRMLLPGPPGEDGAAQEDPRMELVIPLVEYAKAQQVAESLGSRFVLGRDVFARGLADDFQEGGDAPQEALVGLSLFELAEAWRSLAQRPQAKETGLSFRMETVTIGERLQEIREFLVAAKSAHFSELSLGEGGPLEASLSFLAVLELARTGFLRMWQDIEADPGGPRLFLANPDADATLSQDYK
jgi:segregation and condensation protein A